jgi:hypothetical protein
VGLEERRESLVALQPSLARVFDLIEIRAWSEAETRDFFRTTFRKVNIALDDAALDLLTLYAGGLPVMGHEIGDAVFKVDSDGRIDTQDAAGGIFLAADIIGRKHLQPQILLAIRSPRYRTILRKLSEVPFWFRRKEVLGRLSEEEVRVFDNFLRRMNKLRVITRDSEKGVGAYRFANQLHYLYFFMEAARARETERPAG